MAEITAIAPNESGNMVVVSMADQAVKKLEGEMKKHKEPYAQIILKYLIGRVKESESLAKDVMQEHKAWDRCWKYIYAKASKAPRNGNCAAVEDSVVFEWAEDYYIKDDKAEAEKEAKAEAEKASKKKDASKGKAKPAEKKTKKKEAEAAEPEEKETVKAASEVKAPKRDAEKKKEKKPKKDKAQVEGQMSLEDLFGGF